MNTESDASVQSNSAGWILFEHAGLRVCWGEDPLAEEQDYRGEWNTCLPEDRLIYPELCESSQKELSENALAHYKTHESFPSGPDHRFAAALPTGRWPVALRAAL